MKLGICALAVCACASAASAQQTVTLWDTGVEQVVLNNGTPTYLGLSSGNIAATAPQRWYAQPFNQDSSTNVLVTEMDVHYFIPAGFEPANIKYIIWRRLHDSGNTPPTSRRDPSPPPNDPSEDMDAPINNNPITSNVDVVSEGVLGPGNTPGITDPRGGATGGLHTFTGLCISLAPGNYYLTVYADGIGSGNTTGFNNCAWFIGGQDNPPGLEREAGWRSSVFPGTASQGFLTYTGLAAIPFQDPNLRATARYNTCFALRGYDPAFADCNTNGQNDYCEHDQYGNPFRDCNSNVVADFCDIASGSSTDCNSNGTPDDCEPGQEDCNTNGRTDSCEPGFRDCNHNGNFDICDTGYGNSLDCNTNTTPDECESDCDTNGQQDACDIGMGAPDCNTNGRPDICDIATYNAGPPKGSVSNDCNTNGVPDECDTPTQDCNTNGREDICDLGAGHPQNYAFVPLVDDCNTNEIPDACEIAGGATDCNTNGVLDICDVGGAPLLNQTYAERVTTAQGPFFTDLPSDFDATPVTGSSRIGVTAGDFHLSHAVRVTDLLFEGDYNTNGVAGDGSQDTFTIRFWTDVSNRPGTVEASVDVSAANPGEITRVSEGDPFYAYLVHLPTPINLSAGNHWFEVGYTSTGNTNDWNVICYSNYSTTGRGRMVLATNNPETWAFNWLIGGAANDFAAHISLLLLDVADDANTNGVPDECDVPQCTGCRGDLNVNGVLDGDDIGQMVQCAISGPGISQGCPCADINNDGMIDGADVAEFANREVLQTPPCP